MSSLTRDLYNTVLRGVSDALLRIPEREELPYTVILGEIRRLQERFGYTETLIGDIMSAISDFAAAMKDFNDRQDQAVANLVGDVKKLNDDIAKLQATPGQITPEDQALLDGVQARAKTIADNLDALDAQTPPAPPPG